MITRLLIIALISGACWLAWLAWLPEQLPVAPVAVEIYVPPSEEDDGSRWRVVTQRMVWKEAVEDLRRRLQRYGLKAELMTRKEEVPLFVFDDARVFTTLAAASQACLAWRRRGIECDPQKQDQRYKLAIGRYYIPEYARKHEQKLQQSGLAYTLDERTIRIPVMRFIFPAMPHKQAQAVWQQLRQMGVTQPVLMRQQDFERMYAAKQ